MRPTSIDLRKRVVAARIKDGLSMGQIAERFKIPKGTVQNILERYRDAGTLEPKPQNPGRKPGFDEQALLRLEEDVLAHPDDTLEGYLARSGKSVTLTCVHNTLKRLKLTLKKKRYVRANSSNRKSRPKGTSGVNG